METEKSPGSQTNASEAVDDIKLKAKPHPEEVVDAGVMQTFPASDPPAVEKAFETAHDREKRKGKGRDESDRDISPAKERSPDWMFRPPA